LTAVQTVVDAIQSISFGKKTTFQNLAIVPILGAGEVQPDYLTLDEALANGSIEVTEVSETGHVPELKVVVKGAASVLLLDGEELVGAMQNRVLNLTPRTGTPHDHYSCLVRGVRPVATRVQGFHICPANSVCRRQGREDAAGHRIDALNW